MWKSGSSEKRIKAHGAADKQQQQSAFSISRVHAWLLVIGGTLLTGLIDHLATTDIWMGPAYLMFVGLAAWMLGWRQAIGVLALSMAISVIIHGSSVYPYAHPATLGDIAVRVGPVIALISLLSYSRNFSEREWHMARTDALTGALNRKAFFEMAGSVEHAKSWHVLAYADLDGLKQLNDEHGHEQGDESLKAFASNVRKAIRKRDLFARLGGDEFLVYLAVRDAKAGLEVANRLHRAMNAIDGEASTGLRCSVGALILAPGPRAIDQELRAADELMYEAKRYGAALTVATARARVGGLITEGRWVLTPEMSAHAQAQRELSGLAGLATAENGATQEDARAKSRNAKSDRAKGARAKESGQAAA